jgi:hypothetical protein
LMLLFIGFNRLWHFVHIRLDAMVCGFFHLTRLPVARHALRGLVCPRQAAICATRPRKTFARARNARD